MLNNIYCVPDEKDSRKRTLFLVYFADCTHDAHCQNCPVGVTGECIYSHSSHQLHCHCPGKKIFKIIEKTTPILKISTSDNFMH